MPTYFATEFRSIRPTRDFARALIAAEREADSRGCSVNLYENGRLTLVIHPLDEAGGDS